MGMVMGYNRMRWDRVPAALSVSIVTVPATDAHSPKTNKRTRSSGGKTEDGPMIMPNICP